MRLFLSFIECGMVDRELPVKLQRLFTLEELIGAKKLWNFLLDEKRKIDLGNLAEECQEHVLSLEVQLENLEWLVQDYLTRNTRGYNGT